MDADIPRLILYLMALFVGSLVMLPFVTLGFVILKLDHDPTIVALLCMIWPATLILATVVSWMKILEILAGGNKKNE